MQKVKRQANYLKNISKLNISQKVSDTSVMLYSQIYISYIGFILKDFTGVAQVTWEVII